MAPRKTVNFLPNSKAYHHHYRGALPAFRGTIYQDGYGLGSIFGSLFRSAIPFLKSTALSAGKTLLKSGAQAIGDVMSGERDVKSALKHHGIRGLKEVGKDVSSSVIRRLNTNQQGSGLRRKTRKRLNDIFDSQLPIKRRRYHRN